MTTTIDPPTSIGFIGLGNMGYPMATRLCEAGYHLTVSDLNRETVQKFCQQNSASAASSLRELGQICCVVITMLPDGNAVRKVLLGEVDNVVSGLQHGAILIDMSSSSPVDTKVLAAELQQSGFPLVDAPVSGGDVGAREARLSN